MSHTKELENKLLANALLKAYNEGYNKGISDAADLASSFSDYDPDRDGRMIARKILYLLIEDNIKNDSGD